MREETWWIKWEREVFVKEGEVWAFAKGEKESEVCKCVRMCWNYKVVLHQGCVVFPSSQLEHTHTMKIYSHFCCSIEIFPGNTFQAPNTDSLCSKKSNCRSAECAQICSTCLTWEWMTAWITCYDGRESTEQSIHNYKKRLNTYNWHLKLAKFKCFVESSDCGGKQELPLFRVKGILFILENIFVIKQPAWAPIA